MSSSTTHSFFVCFIVVSTINILVADVLENKDKCGYCVKPDKCRIFREMNKDQKTKWREDNPCFHTPDGEIDDHVTQLYGFSTTAKGDLICCPGPNVWGIEGRNIRKSAIDHDNVYSNRNNNDDDLEDSFETQHIKSQTGDPNLKEDLSAFNEYRPGMHRRRGRHHNRRRGTSNNNVNGIIHNHYNNESPARSQNGYYRNQNVQRQNTCQYEFPVLPRDPQTKCCGIDIFTENKDYNQQPSQNSNWNPPRPAPSWARYARAALPETFPSLNVTIDPRITGGFQTELEEYPWTAFIQTTFDFGQKSSTFNCGGSLIGGRHVLTAGHCVSDSTAKGVNKVDVRLGEYDKRYFPEDCKYVQGIGRKCITNILIPAEKIIPHPDFNEAALQNDIALIRLSQNAPYKDYIRPICLPMFSVDNPKFMDLRVAVVGWGRDKQGEQISQIKQATVVNLVPYQNCAKYYPTLTRNHLCAAGKSGQDSCKGDSGGPLMVLYQNQYYIAGIVSGKRSDTKCGSRIPSLYTNVYYYIDWIMGNIQ